MITLGSLVLLIGGLGIGWFSVDESSVVAGVLGIVAFGGAFLCIPWYCWAFPVIDARNTRPSWKYAPRQRRTLLMTLIWLPTFFITLSLFALIFIGTTQGGADPMAIQVVGGLLIFSLLCAAPCHIVSRRFFRNSVAAMKLCYHCGYDLRATTGEHCPECGHPIGK